MIRLLRAVSLTVLAFAVLAAIPLAASAGTAPPVNVPDAASLATSKPVFTWGGGPAGEYISSIAVSTSAALDASGSIGTTNGTFLYPLKNLTSKATNRPMYAGQYYFNAQWNSADGQPYESGHTPVQSFVIPTMLKNLAGVYYQYRYITSFAIKGKYITNARAAVVQCRVYYGRRIITSQKLVQRYPVIAGYSSFYCGALRVANAYNGKRLKAMVIVSANGRAIARYQYFRAV